MCYHPITIVNPTKYVSLKYRDRFLLQVPCGKCAQCQQRKVNEYYYRAYHQCIDTLGKGFVIFDTLSYNDKYLPHITDFIQTNYNFSCFNSKHVRDFMKKLRQRCKRKYKSNFTYFLTSEYGTSEYYNYHGRIRKATHRPHYHVLFFVQGNIKPLDFSKLASDCWQYGRTDGLPYKTSSYVLSNVLSNSDPAKSIRVLKYVSKYIAKTSSFQRQIDKRINLIMNEIAEKMPDGWIDSFNATLVKEKIKRNINQFHRQSTHFGETALSSMDLNKVMQEGKLSIVDNKKIVMSIPLPTYYKRKLFYKLVYVDDAPIWTPTEFGYEYLKVRQNQLFKDMKNRYEAAMYQACISFDVDKLVDYVNNKRGRIMAKNPESTLDQRLASINFFKYATRYDRDAIGKLGLFTRWLGNSKRGYERIFVSKRISLQYFAEKFTYHNDEMEKILDKIADAYKCVDDGKQKAYELRQHLTNLYKYLSS